MNFFSKKLIHLFTFCAVVPLNNMHAQTSEPNSNKCLQNLPCLHPWGTISVWGEYLYWKVVQDQIQYAAVLPGGVQQIIQEIQATNDGAPLTISEKLSIVEPSFKYKSGFRVGAGYALRHSNWDFELAWTRLHEKINSKVTESARGIIPLSLQASIAFGFISGEPSMFGFADKAKSHWNFEFDTIDFQIGRKCCVQKNFNIHPYLGVKAAFIRQNQHIRYYGFSTSEEPVIVKDRKKNNFCAVGPSIGFDASWEFYPHFNLLSELSAAELCGNFDVKENPSISLPPNSIKIELNNSRKHRLRPTIDAKIGLDWDSCISNKCQLVLGAFYELQYWWNQFQAPSSIATSILTGGSSPQGDLMMYGLTVHGGVRF